MSVKLKVESEFKDKGIKGAKSGLTELGNHASGIFRKLGAIVAGAFAFNTIKNFVTSSISAFNDSEKAAKELESALITAGESTDIFLPILKNVASALQLITRVEDDTIISTMALASTMGIAADNLDEAGAAAAVFSKKFGVGVDSAMRGVAKAFAGNTAQLGKYIPALRGVTDAGDAFNIIVAMTNNLLREQVNVSGTNAERIDAIKVSWGELKEKFGEFIMNGDGVTTLLDELLFSLEEIQTSGFTEWIEETFPTLAKWGKILSDVANSVDSISEFKREANDVNTLLGTSMARGVSELDVAKSMEANSRQFAPPSDRRANLAKARAARLESRRQALARQLGIGGLSNTLKPQTPTTAPQISASRSLSTGDLFDIASQQFGAKKPGESASKPIYVEVVNGEEVGGLGED